MVPVDGFYVWCIINELLVIFITFVSTIKLLLFLKFTYYCIKNWCYHMMYYDGKLRIKQVYTQYSSIQWFLYRFHVSDKLWNLTAANMKFSLSWWQQHMVLLMANIVMGHFMTAWNFLYMTLALSLIHI